MRIVWVDKGRIVLLNDDDDDEYKAYNPYLINGWRLLM